MDSVVGSLIFGRGDANAAPSIVLDERLIKSLTSVMGSVGGVGVSGAEMRAEKAEE